jgi:hypothetical protein
MERKASAEAMSEFGKFMELCLALAKTMSPSGDYIGAGPEARKRIIREAKRRMGR